MAAEERALAYRYYAKARWPIRGAYLYIIATGMV